MYAEHKIYCSEFAKLLPAGLGTVHFLDHIFRFLFILDVDHVHMFRGFSLLSRRTLDLDGNGYLDFKENMLAMDLVNAKTPVDKLKWAFRM